MYLNVDRVSKRYGDFSALRDVSLGILAGEFITLLGPSGCGKTTLLRTIAGFVVPDGGRVTIEGQDITALPPYRRPIGMVFQNLALFPHMTVNENVAFGPTLGPYDKSDVQRRVDELLQVVGLAGFNARRVSQLSGGQRQRVALARALIMEPKVLLLDEPLSALDLKLRRQLQIELKRLQRRTGTTFVFVTHDQEEAMAMSDRIAVFNAGRIEQIGTPDEIYERPKTRFVAEFVGETNLFEVSDRSGGARIDELDVSLAGIPARIAGPAGGLISVRPEHVSIAAPGAMGPRFRARIVEREYGGGFVRMTALAEHSGRPVRIVAPAAEAGRVADGDVADLVLDIGRAARLGDGVPS